MPRIKLSRTRFPKGRFFFLACLLTASLRAQTPALTITPSDTIGTLDAQAVLPAAVAYDASGNLYIADAAEHIILKRDTFGTVTVIAGDRHQDFRGDGGPAIAASLDTPLGIALDPSGNLYIADAHNHRVRRVDTKGMITTIAGNGACAFSGDGTPATSASLCLPSAVAVAPNGSIAIADQRNHRIRSLDSKGILTTIAGNGEQRFSGDTGQATAAGLDSPAGLAFDGSGNLLIADTHNQRIRRVDPSGIITTIAGTGLAGSAGDNGNAAAAQLSRPTGMTVTSAGDILIADRGNQRIRAIASDSITTIVGNGDEASLGDNSKPQTAALSSPRSIASTSGAFTIAAGTLRQTAPAVLSFGFQKITAVSQPLTLRLANTGTSALKLRSLVLPGGFSQGQGSCPSIPAVLPVGASCNLAIAFNPSAAAANDSFAYLRVDGLPLQTIRLTGAGYSPSTSLAIAPIPASYTGVPITLTATLTASGPSSPTGSITFTDGGTPLGQAGLLSGTPSLSGPPVTTATATLTTTALSAGTHSIAASYGGDNNYDASASPPLVASITALPNFTLAQDSTVSGAASVAAGGSAQYRFFVNIPAGALTSPVTFAVAGLPAGAVATFTPTALSSSGSVTLNVTAPASRAWLPCILLLPAFQAFRRKRRFLVLLPACVVFLGLQGCGSTTARQLSSSYNLIVTATATTVAGAPAQQQIQFSLTVL